MRMQEIVDAAEELFLLKGYEKTGIDEIAYKSGFTKRTVYSYFSSKENIYYEVVLRTFKKLNTYMDECEQKIRNIKNISALEKILRICECYFDFHIANPKHASLIIHFNTNKHNDHMENTTVQKIYSEGEKLFFDKYLVEGIEEKSIKQDISTAELQIMFWAFINGICEIMEYKGEYLNKNHSMGKNKLKKISLNFIKNAISC